MSSASRQIETFSEDNDELSTDDLYLIFHLAQEDYGVSIKHVTEIVGRQNVSRVPNMPNYVIGVINLRGQVIPVIDVRIRFGIPFRDYDERTCSIVIHTSHSLFGLIVDSVDEVISIAPDMISSPPLSANTLSACYIKGIGRISGSDSVKIILDVNLLLPGSELRSALAPISSDHLNSTTK